MKRLLLFLLALSSLKGWTQAGVTVVDSIPCDGLNRKFRLYVPNSYSANVAVPLIINMHGYTSNAISQQFYANFMPIADTANFLVVHPDGTLFQGNQFWNAGFGPAPNDVKFISNLIDSLSLLYNIDQNRVYSCGMSNGGIMSYYLACNLPNKIAAIASVTGSMLNSWFTCVPQRPFPVMEIHGTNDGTVPYNGDATFANIDSVIKKWRVFNNCTPVPQTFTVPDINQTDNSTAVNYRYVNGTSGVSVELFKVNGGGHSWPGAVNVMPLTNQDFSASKEIWRFFRQYKLNLITTIPVNPTIESDVNVFPNPANEFIYLTDGSIYDYKMMNMSGALVKEGTASQRINVKDLKEGVYFLYLNTGTTRLVKKIIIR